MRTGNSPCSLTAGNPATTDHDDEVENYPGFANGIMAGLIRKCERSRTIRTEFLTAMSQLLTSHNARSRSRSKANTQFTPSLIIATARRPFRSGEE